MCVGLLHHQKIVVVWSVCDPFKLRLLPAHRKNIICTFGSKVNEACAECMQTQPRGSAEIRHPFRMAVVGPEESHTWWLIPTQTALQHASSFVDTLHPPNLSHKYVVRRQHLQLVVNQAQAAVAACQTHSFVGVD
jgi:hypothetical protein